MLRHKPMGHLRAWANPGNLFKELGCLPQLKTLTLWLYDAALYNGCLPRLRLIAPTLKRLFLVLSQDMLSDLQSLQHHPTLTLIAMDARALQNPNQLPSFLPPACLVRKSADKIRLWRPLSGPPFA